MFEHLVHLSNAAHSFNDVFRMIWWEKVLWLQVKEEGQDDFKTPQLH